MDAPPRSKSTAAAAAPLVADPHKPTKTLDDYALKTLVLDALIQTIERRH